MLKRSVYIYKTKKIIYLFLLITSIGCNNSNKLIGSWTLIRTVKDGVTKKNSELSQIEFTKDGKLLFFYNKKESGFGSYFYKRKINEIYITVVITDTIINNIKKNDSTNLPKVLFSIKNDTLILEENKVLLYYKRDSKK